MHTYKETVLRYRIFRHDELPDEHKAALRAEGIDPDNEWALIYSFADKADADAQLVRSRSTCMPWQTFKLVDNGESTVITRPLW